MLNVLSSTAQKIITLESIYSSYASSSGLNDHTGGRRATSRTRISGHLRLVLLIMILHHRLLLIGKAREEGGRRVLPVEILATLENPDVNTWAMGASTLLLNFIVKDARVRFASTVSRSKRTCVKNAPATDPDAVSVGRVRLAAAIAATEKVEIFCNVLRAANRYSGLGSYRFNDIVGKNLLSGYDAWRTPLNAGDHPEFLAREVEDVFRSYCSGLARSDNFDLRALCH